MDFLCTGPGSAGLRGRGLSPVVQSVFRRTSAVPTPSGLFKIDQFGGWDKVADPFFGDSGWVTQAEKDLGNPTS